MHSFTAEFHVQGNFEEALIQLLRGPAAVLLVVLVAIRRIPPCNKVH